MPDTHKLHTKDNDRLELTHHNGTATSIIWSKGLPVRSINFYGDEIDWLIKGLQEGKEVEGAGAVPFENGRS